MSDAFLPSPHSCVPLEQLVAPSGGVWVRRTPEIRVDYALPADAAPELLAYLRPLAAATLPAGGLARLPEGRVFGSGVVLSADGEFLARDVSADFGKAFGVHWLLGYEKIRSPVALAGTSAVVAVNRGAGYCHWLLEELPRLLALGQGGADNIIVHAAGAFAREALALRGGTEAVIQPRRAAHFACAPLLVPTLSSEAGAPTPEALRSVRAFAAQLGRGRSGAGERVYFSREKAARRQVTNEAALWAELKGRGFTRVFLEDLSWAEQIAICRGARVVVSPHGAGLANLVFCERETRVIELLNRTYFNPTFWRVSVLGGLDYRPVVAAGEEPLDEDRRANRNDIMADLAQVRKALAA